MPDSFTVHTIAQPSAATSNERACSKAAILADGSVTRPGAIDTFQDFVTNRYQTGYLDILGFSMTEQRVLAVVAFCTLVSFQNP